MVEWMGCPSWSVHFDPASIFGCRILKTKSGCRILKNWKVDRLTHLYMYENFSLKRVSKIFVSGLSPIIFIICSTPRSNASRKFNRLFFQFYSYYIFSNILHNFRLDVNFAFDSTHPKNIHDPPRNAFVGLDDSECMIPMVCFWFKVFQIGSIFSIFLFEQWFLKFCWFFGHLVLSLLPQLSASCLFPQELITVKNFNTAEFTVFIILPALC